VYFNTPDTLSGMCYHDSIMEFLWKMVLTFIFSAAQMQYFLVDKQNGK